MYEAVDYFYADVDGPSLVNFSPIIRYIGYYSTADSISFMCHAWEDDTFGVDGFSLSWTRFHINLLEGPFNTWIEAEEKDDDVTHYVEYRIANYYPVVNSISGPSSIHPGDLGVTYTAEASDEDGDSLTYEWSMAGVKFPEKTGATSTWNINDSPVALGDWTIDVRAKDAFGFYIAWFTKDISCVNESPSANPILGPNFVYRGDTATFYVIANDLEDDLPLRYQWKIDGEIVGINDPTLQYVHPMEWDTVGTHSVAVKVTDTLGGTIEVTKTFTTLNHPPTVTTISGPTSGERGSTHVWSASAEDPEDDINWEWYVDGTPTWGQGQQLYHKFTSNDALGPHIISVRVIDEIGDYSDYATLTFTLLESSGPKYYNFPVTLAEGKTYFVGTCSNSSIIDVDFNQTEKKIKFAIDGTSGTYGFCNITIPAEFMNGTFTVSMDNRPLVKNVDYTETYNGTHYILAINYQHSSHVIEIVSTVIAPEFTSWLFLPFLMLATLSAIIAKRYRKRRNPI